MSVPKRQSTTPPSPNDLKHRVITCLNKLSDRDTLAVATTELDSIAKTLPPDSFSPFLTCLSTTDSSAKSPVRKQCVRLLSILSTSHGDSLSPHLSKMLSAVLLRLRDSDSAVRSACVAAVSSMASQITKPPFSSLSKPLVEAILHEQDYNLQIGSALCLAAAIEAAPDPEPAQLQKLLPKLMKLIKNDSFKAKPAMLSLIGSIVGAGGAKHRNALKCLIQCLVEFLSCEDWAARKAAAEALLRLAMTNRNILTAFKSSCLASLENRRFDKVKVVRDTMNRTFESWKGIPDEEVLPLSQSSIDSQSGTISPPVSEGPMEIGFETPKPKKTILTSMSPSSDSSSTAAAATTAITTTVTPTTQKSIPLKTNPRQQKMEFKKYSDLKTEIAVPQPPNLQVACNDNFRIANSRLSGSSDNERCSNLKQEAKKVVLLNKTCDEKSHKFGGLRSRSRVVPFIESENCEINVADDEGSDNIYENHREVEDMSLLQKQLLQIENQQSSLLDLLQRFIGSSQSGMNSLETRVNGLEMVLDEISGHLPVSSSGNVSDTDSAGNSTCCMLPRAEFLSPKFWRRPEGQYSTTSRVSSSGRSLAAMSSNMPVRHANTDIFKLDNPQNQQQNGAISTANFAGGTFRGSRPISYRTPKKIFQYSEMVHVHSSSGLDGVQGAKKMIQVNKFGGSDESSFKFYTQQQI